MGVPHGGTHALARWAQYLADGLNFGGTKKANSRILEVLKADSQVLDQMQDQFHDIISFRNQRIETEILIACFYEELPLFDLGFVSSDLDLDKCQSAKIRQVVPKESATLRGYPSSGLHFNHSDMTRLDDPDGAAFKALIAQLTRWTDALRGHSPFARRDKPTSEKMEINLPFRTPEGLPKLTKTVSDDNGLDIGSKHLKFCE